MSLIDIYIDAGIVVCLLIISIAVYFLWRRDEFYDPYHEIPTQRFTRRISMTDYNDPNQQQQDPNQPQQDPNQQPQQDPNQQPDQQPQQDPNQDPGQESEESKYKFGDDDEKAGLSSKPAYVSDHPRGSTPDEPSPDDQSHEAAPQPAQAQSE